MLHPHASCVGDGRARESKSAALLASVLVLAPAEALAQPLAPPSDLAPEPVIPPRLLVDSPAEYPEAARKARFRETVTVGLVLDISATGAVTRVKVEASQGNGFDEAAVAAASKLRFEPARQGTQPTSARIRFRYAFKPPAPRLGGRVARRDTDAPIEGARITVTAGGVERVARTAANGTWSLDGLPAGKVHVAVSAPGSFAAATDEELAPGEETRVVVRLEPEASAAPAVEPGDTAPLEVEVRGERPPREVTKRTLDRAEIALIPGTNGDALKFIESLPGVARPPPFSGLLAVRGSAPQDTTVSSAGRRCRSCITSVGSARCSRPRSSTRSTSTPATTARSGAAGPVG